MSDLSLLEMVLFWYSRNYCIFIWLFGHFLKLNPAAKIFYMNFFLA
jgi:hypothetical protein